jgi:hypothetical protein
MKLLYKFLFFFLLSGAAMAQNYDWVKLIDGGNNIISATAPNGTTYVYGDFGGSITVGSQTFNSTNGDHYIAAYSSTGAVLAAVQLDSVTVMSMVATNSFLYISGQYADGADIGSTNLMGMDDREGLIAVLDPSLNVVMQITGQNDGTSETFYGVDVDNLGNIYLATSFRGDSIYVGSASFTGAASQEKGLFIKFSPTGTILLSDVYEMTGNGGFALDDVEVDLTTGTIYLTGSSDNDAALPLDSIILSPTVEYQPGANSENSFVMVMNALGTVTDIKDFTDIYQEFIRDIEVDEAGSPYITIGHFVNGYSIIKLDGMLDTVWISGAASGGSAMMANGFEVMGGKVLVTGFYDGTADFPGTAYDVTTSTNTSTGFIEVLDAATGNVTKVSSISSFATYNEMYDVGADLAGNVYVAGVITGNSYFDTIYVNTTSGQHGFLARMPAGVFVGETSIVKSNDLQTYPNPASDVLYVKSSDAITVARVYDVTGKMMFEKNVAAGSFTLPVRDLPQGVYILNLTGEKSVVSKRFIKE